MIAKLALVLLVGSVGVLAGSNEELNGVLDDLFNRGQEVLELEKTFEKLQLAKTLAKSATDLNDETQKKVDLVTKLIPLNDLDETPCQVGDLSEYISLGDEILPDVEDNGNVPSAFAYVKIHQKKRYSYCVRQELISKLEFIGLVDRKDMIKLKKLIAANYKDVDEENSPSDPLVEAISGHLAGGTSFKSKEDLIENASEYHNRYEELVDRCQTVHDTLNDFRNAYKPYESLLEWYTQAWISIVDACNAILDQPAFYAEQSYKARLDKTPKAAFSQQS